MAPIRDNNNTRLVPHLEGLEPREVPAVQIFVTDHVLHVIGDAHADTITVRDNGQGTITVTDGGEKVTASGIHEVSIVTGRGADRVSYKLTGPLKTTEDIGVWLGRGADRANFNFSDGVATGGHLKLAVHGGPGADREAVTIGSIAKGGTAVLDLYGGKGNDTLSLHASGTDSGSLSADLHGGSGHNTETVDVTATVTRWGHLFVKTT
ncbi:hypothetical protein [Frigoriglobus tundricola]|nr:hypothetical protein [Frigoriglobus tundricola]